MANRPATFNINKALSEDRADGLEPLASTDEGMNFVFEVSDPCLPDELRYGPPLIVAATYHKAQQCIDYILTQGVENEQIDLLGRTAIHFAALRGHLELLQFEAFGQYDFNAKDWRNRIPLHYAIMAGQTEAATYLIDHEGADVNYADKFGYNSVHIAAEAGNLALVKFLLEKGGHVVNDRNGLPPMYIALQRNKIDVFNHFLKLTPQTHNWTLNGGNLLHFAAQFGRPEVIKTLTTDYNDLNVNELDQYGCAPIHYAVQHNHVPAVEQLLQVKDIDFKIKTTDNVTPLFLGIHHGSTRSVQIIFERDLTQREALDSNQATPLHVSALYGKRDLVQYFLEKRVSRAALDGDGKKAQELARGTHAEEIRNLIINWIDHDEKSNKGGCCCCEVA